jgi:ferritin-like metal-binding protein YciE
MPQSLRDLYIEELRDLYSAEQQILQALPTMAAAAHSDQLKQAFEEHLEQTRMQKERLDLIFEQLGVSPTGKPCKGMEGLLAEGRERLHEGAPADVRDAALIAAAQRVEHYEIAGYGTARTYARLLGDWDGARLLQQTIEEEGDADHRLTAIAQSGVNQAAAAGDRGAETEHWSRLRYVEAAAIRDEGIDYDKLELRNNVGDDLGSLDGFVVTGDTGRPLYYVVDSGGWFVGRRYLVPIGKGRLDPATRTLVIDLDKEQIKRYPEFSTNAFLSMSEDQLRGYERRLIGATSPQASRSATYWRSYDELPEYQQPSWLHSERWHASETRRPVGSVAAPESDWDAPSTPPTPRITDTTREPEAVVAHSEEERRRDPRLNELSQGVRGVGESAPRRMDDDDMAR